MELSCLLGGEKEGEVSRKNVEWVVQMMGRGGAWSYRAYLMEKKGNVRCTKKM